MTDQRALSLGDRFKQRISDADEKKGKEIESAKKERLHEAERLVKEPLTGEKKEGTSRLSRSLQNVENAVNHHLYEYNRVARKQDREDMHLYLHPQDLQSPLSPPRRRYLILPQRPEYQASKKLKPFAPLSTIMKSK